MAKVSLAVKKAYFARVRNANYAESLRLEGFKVVMRANETGQYKQDKASLLAKWSRLAKA